MRFLIWLLTNAIALAVAAWLLPGIRIQGADWQDKAVPLIVVALILGVVTAIVKPIVKLLSLPLIILTVGLFLLVINAAMLLLTEKLADAFDLGFTVADFWPSAVLGGVVITLVTWLVDVALEDAE